MRILNIVTCFDICNYCTYILTKAPPLFANEHHSGWLSMSDVDILLSWMPRQ